MRFKSIVQTFVLLLFCTYGHAEQLFADPSKAYLIFDIEIKGQKKQPTFIAFNDATEEDHFPVGADIVAVEPGTYEFTHLDFGSDYRFSMHSMEFEYGYELNLTASTVLFFGKLQLRRLRHYRESSSRIDRRPRFKRLDDIDLLVRACKKAPNIFSSCKTYNMKGEEIPEPCTAR